MVLRKLLQCKRHTLFLTKEGVENGIMCYRLVVDFRYGNKDMRRYGLRNEHLRDFGNLLWRQNWLVTFDLKFVYLKIHAAE